MNEIFSQIDPVLIISIFGTLLLFGIIYFGTQTFTTKRNRGDIQKRLDIDAKFEKREGTDKKTQKNQSVRKSPSKKTTDFYATSDPKATRKLQLSLIQAGFLDPSAVQRFLAIRFAMGLAGLAISVVLMITVYSDYSLVKQLMIVLFSGVFGYILPSLYLRRRIGELVIENRSGFPDVMDLMVVAAEAGLTTEASIERIAKEISTTYPSLSTQLNVAALEIRAGRAMDQALRSLGERLGLDEVQGFATMIQQSKELGTSVSDALRVYSDEMRHKRMMKAEEKAYALPAKMSIPVTVFILPIVVGVAVVPTVIRLMTG
ncbi:MAG: type II secretion system F family protein [Rhizobiaceae bacterium]|nr:type II secretion system F family protein [Rhizobiaceae bacterium]